MAPTKLSLERVDRLHKAAMHWADAADLARARASPRAECTELLERALSLENEAIGVLLQGEHSGSAVEPTRSILCRSAATLALECGHLVTTSALTSLGLRGAPPGDVRDELEELRDFAQRERQAVQKHVGDMPTFERLLEFVVQLYTSGDRVGGNQVYFEVLDSFSPGDAARFAREVGHALQAFGIPESSLSVFEQLPQTAETWEERVDALCCLI